MDDANARDRDARGRPRNDRPRDGLGRPLPRGAVGEQRIPDDVVLPPAQALDEAQRLLDAGRPFHAHEVLEGTWKATDTDERDLWQGLAQLAVGLTHAARGNLVGAARLIGRGADRMAPFAETRPHGVDVPGLLAWAATTSARLAAGERAAATTPPRLRADRTGSDERPRSG